MASRLSSLRGFARAHPRLLIGVQLVVLGIFFGFVGWALRGSFHAAGNDLRNADPVYFVLACVAVAAYYLVFVLGWMRILADWDIHLTYAAALRAEMVSMLAKYVPGGVWTPAARVVAARHAGVTDGALVTASMLLEAGISAVAGVIVFVVSLAWVRGVNAPIAPLIAFGVVVAVLLHPRVFRPLASKVLRRLGYHELPPLRGSTMGVLLVFYSGTWIVGGTGLWLLLRAVGAHPPVSLGVRAVGSRPARGVHVWVDARDHRRGRCARRDAVEPRRDHDRRGAAARRRRRAAATARRGRRRGRGAPPRRRSVS